MGGSKGPPIDDMGKKEWPSNPHRAERAQDAKPDRLENGLFRCERCGSLWPLPYILNDGARVCRRDADVLTPLEAQTSMADDRARAGAYPEPTLELPVSGALNGAAFVTDVSPLTLNLTRGGAAGAIEITGVNLSASDTWSSSNATHITVTPTVNSTTSVSLSITADGTTTRADYDLTFNGDTLTPRGILRVR